MENLNEIKLKLIQKIIRIKDIEVLLKLQEYIESFENSQKLSSVNEKKAIYQAKITFTEEQIKMLAEAEKDIENGNSYSNDEVRKMTEEWLT